MVETIAQTLSILDYALYVGLLPQEDARLFSRLFVDIAPRHQQ